MWNNQPLQGTVRVHVHVCWTVPRRQQSECKTVLFYFFFFHGVGFSNAAPLSQLQVVHEKEVW